jgi:hypothetical protein
MLRNARARRLESSIIGLAAGMAATLAPLLAQAGRSSLFLEPPWAIQETQADKIVSVHGVGDVNGDGYSDLAIVRRRNTSDTPYPEDSGAVQIFHGRPEGLPDDGAPDFEIDFWFLDNIQPWRVIGVGDVHCDGYDDVLIDVPARLPPPDVSPGIQAIVRAPTRSRRCPVRTAAVPTG